MIALEDENAYVREYAARNIGTVLVGDQSRQAHTEVIEPLRRRLTDVDVNVQKEAIKSLGWMDEAASVAVPDIAQKLTNKDLALDAIQCLGRIGPSAAYTTDAIIDAWTDRSLRAACIETLAQLGPEALPAVLKRRNPDLRGAVLSHISRSDKLDYSARISDLLDALSHNERRRVRIGAATVLSMVQWEVLRPHFVELVDLLTDETEDIELRRALLEQVARGQHDFKPQVEGIVLKLADGHLRAESATVLGELAKDTSSSPLDHGLGDS